MAPESQGHRELPCEYVLDLHVSCLSDNYLKQIDCHCVRALLCASWARQVVYRTSVVASQQQRHVLCPLVTYLGSMQALLVRVILNTPFPGRLDMRASYWIQGVVIST